MWDLGNRGVFLLISVLSGCAFLYSLRGPILTLTISLLVVIYACYSLLVNDSLLSPHALLAFEYLKDAGCELNEILISASVYISEKVRELRHFLRTFYQNRIVRRMSKHRQSTYQLSNDSHMDTRNSSRFNHGDQLSPIARQSRRSLLSESQAENTMYMDNSIRKYDGSINKHTSTPLVPWKREARANGDIGLFGSGRSPHHKTHPMNAQNHTLFRGETTVFSPEGSPWGTSISPKMQTEHSGVKTIQTVAGPLLASTRYNIDLKTYSDVTSPGLASRLTMYAGEANNKLTHQSRYAAGQFPKINLSAGSAPLISPKSAKMRTPVTVRVAPPDTTKYSPPERQRILSDVCQNENKVIPSVMQVLRDISLKRHASREDVTSEYVKKQRTDGMYNEDLENLEEMTQKRAREESPKLEDLSPQSRALRPVKRTKTPSCYDVLNSLSSSIHVPSGVKRKAMDISRSGTPDLEKHFKSSDSVQTTNSSTLSQPEVEIVKIIVRNSNERTSSSSDIVNLHKSLRDHYPTRGILKSAFGKDATANQNVDELQEKHANMVDNRGKMESTDTHVKKRPVNVKDKLFMRAEPASNEKLKTLIREQENIKANFTRDDTDEIKKEDIDNMRQTSMRARLQSMFDAISGKAAKKINPDVVIQAEEVEESTTSNESAHAVHATLNSSTLTTSINTSPIAASTVVPQVTKPKTTPVKHVSFNLPSTESSQSTINNPPASISGTSGFMPENSISAKPETVKTNFSAVSSSESTAIPSSTFSNFITTTSNTTTPTFSFGATSTTAASTTPNTPRSFSQSVDTSSNKLPVLLGTSSTPLSSTQSSNLFPTANTASNPVSTSATPIPITAQSSSTVTFALDSSKSVANIGAPSIFSFGSPSATTGGISTNNQTATSPVRLHTGVTSVTTPALSIPQFGSATNATTAIAATSATPTFNSVVTSNPSAITATPPSFSFGTNAVPSQASKPGTFSFGSTSTVQNIPSFGNTAVTTPSSTFGSVAVTSTPAPTFLSPATANFSFPTSNPIVASTAVTLTTVPTATTTASSFSSNGKTASSGFALPATTSSFSFGTPSNVPTTTKPLFAAFGASTTSTSSNASSPTMTFGATTASGTPSFGTPATSSVQTFGTTTTASVFGGTTSTPLFGTSISQPVFGGAPNSTATLSFGTPKTTAPPAFGSSTGTPIFGGAPSTTNLFSGASTNTPATTTTTTTVPNFAGSNSIFAQANPPPAFGASAPAFGSGATPIFGSQTTATAAFGTVTSTASTAASAFGTPNTAAPAFGTSSTATPIFGSANTGPSVFGTQSAGTGILGAQNAATSPPSFKSASSPFGAATAALPAFGTSTATTSGFGSAATPAFGGQGAASPSFSSVNNNASGFGNPATTFGNQNATSFGAPSSSAPAFGAASNNTFTFGGSQPQTQQGSTFPFSNTNITNNNAASGSAFQFGAATATPAASSGFNFNSPPAAPNLNFGTGVTAFTAPPTGGMFSIGTGSTGARRNRQRRQR